MWDLTPTPHRSICTVMTEEKSGSVELRHYLRILRKRWLIIVAVVLICVAGSAAASLLVMPKYEATTVVFVFVQSSGNAADLSQGNSFAQGQVKSYADAVSTPRVLDSVIEQLGLTESAAELAKSVTATAAVDTVDVTITVDNPSPVAAANIANAVTASFQRVVADITKPSSGASQVLVSVLQPATAPDAPVSPKTGLNLVLGLLAGLVLGLAVAIFIHALDRRIHGEQDVAEITSTPIIGGIAFDPDAADRPLTVQDNPYSVRAEAFRALRTNLRFLEVEPGRKSFVVTSSIPGEGKSTTAANLAIAMADTGVGVVLIDADLRRPKLAGYMGLEGAVGLTDVLVSRVTLEDALQPWGDNLLRVLPAGSIPPNPSELLGSRAMEKLLRKLEADFDVVLVDLPPLLPVTDAAVVTKFTRGALVVVSAGRTHKDELAAALATLQHAGAPAAGIILTMLPTNGPDAYGYRQFAYRRYGAYSDTRQGGSALLDRATSTEPLRFGNQLSEIDD